MAASTTIFVLLGITAGPAYLFQGNQLPPPPAPNGAPRPCTRITVWSFWISSPF